MIMSLLLNTPFKKSFARDYYNYSHCLCIQLFVHRVVSFFFPTSGKRLILFRKLKVGHYCSTIQFKNSITLCPAWTRGVKSKLRKLSSILEFVTRQQLQPHFSVIFYFFFCLVTWLKFQKHPKLGDKIVCSEITELIFL